MSFNELAAKRFSVRKFSDKPIEQEKIDLILKAGQLAPTAKNLQPQRIYLVQSKEGMQKLSTCTPCTFGAPVALLICYDKNDSWKRSFDDKDHGDIDASVVCAHMMFQAQELGLGSTWVCYYDPAAVVREFDLPENIIPSSIMPLGYPADGVAPAPQHAQRKPLSETVIVM